MCLRQFFHQQSRQRIGGFLLLASGMALAIAGVSCGDEEEDSPETTTAPAAVSFTDVNAILTSRCATSGCHGTGASNNVYVGDEALLKTRKSSVISRVNTTKDMPPTNASASQLEMTTAERDMIQTFLNQ